jgi:two-component SAPR family response regulator
VRKLLESALDGRASSLIVRDGNAYCLVVPPGSWVDVVEFDRALAAGRTARLHGDVERGLTAYRSALELYCDELLPEEGPAEWLVSERYRRAAEGCEAAHAIAEMLLEGDDPRGAAAACSRGLRIDRYQDELWRLRIASHRKAGDVAASAHAHREYERVLRELGLTLQPVAPEASGA